ncbi:MAG: translation elongation factor 4 [Bdellovibrionaceae bacterium]|nr:translation elongation factor 4 [Pseudobdellovibrionaceae bacterium]
MSLKNIRNFSIIAHIDHGKSSLADCFLELTQAVDDRTKKDRFLDNMDLERERGITIKAQTVRLLFQSANGQNYQLNLIDTPGHVDFSYEVSRSLSACEGALLVVDACQGIEAQTMANTILALENNLEIIPIINKIDLPAQRVEEVKKQLKDLIGVKEEEILLASAKEKTGIREILEAVVKKVPAPVEEQFESSQFTQSPLRALIFDSWFDSYQGVIALCRIKQGSIKTGDSIYLQGTARECEVLQLGVFTPFASQLEELKTGEVGFVITGIKEISDMRVGDTITHKQTKEVPSLAGFKKARPMVYSGIFPVSSDDFEQLKKALEKLSLNDSSLSYEMESSKILGFGFRCGFLGLLHREIVQERLEREFELNLITTAPSVIYKTYLKKGETLDVENPSLLPDPTKIDYLEEPFAKVQIHSPSEYIGALLKLCEEKRGVQEGIEYISSDRSIIKYKIPLNEMILDFHDRLKSLSRGYASMDYELIGYEQADLVKMDVLLNGEIVDALSVIVHRSQAQQKGRYLAKRLKELIPRQQFQVAIQAAIGAKIIARETLGAYRKDVTAKLYGGDVTRKKKLLEKQKSGKKRMKSIGRIEVPQKAFMALMKTDSK